MADTFTQIHIHIIFGVKNRNSLILPDWENRLYKYISVVVQDNGHKMLQINGMSDHLHMLIGLRPNQSISDLVRIVKSNSSRMINEQKLSPFRFQWQEGFGAFSIAKKEVPKVISYIMNQKSHHKKRNFTQEYRSFLDDYNIEYDERYLFLDPS